LTGWGDVQSGSGLLFALSVFAYACACTAYARSRGWSVGRSLLAVTLATLSGWVMNVAYANNYDNLAALAAFPALMALVRTPAPRASGLWILIAIDMAGLIYTYPELAFIVGGITVIALLEQWWRAGSAQEWRAALGCAALCVLLTNTSLLHAIEFS